MKNELGIEIKCENCWFKYDCDSVVEKTCKRNGRNALFKPSTNAYKSRIRELQKQVAKLEKQKEEYKKLIG